jgi:tRNA G10  N-methylase Trm11
MKYVFILGRNIVLSQAEILSFLEKEENNVISTKENKNAFLVEVEEKIEPGTIKRLGGTLAIGKVLLEGENYSKLDSVMLYMGEENKLNYCLWDYSSDSSKALEYLKDRFKQEKLKATLKHLTGKIEMQGRGKIPKINTKNIQEQYFTFEGEEKYFGRIIEYFNSEEIEKRDMEKPVRRESLAISPRLAKILINLSQAKQGERLVDPFCGIGVILEEALNQGINVIGIDKDKNAIIGAKKNLKWFGFGDKNYEIINEDSKKVKIKQGDAIATEPDLGETLKKMTTVNKAKNTLRNFEELMIRVINNLKLNINGRIVFTSPLIRTIKGRKSANFERIANETGYEMLEGYPIQEYRDKQPVGRDIVVLKKI